jgi:hypothetical protein
MLTIPQVAHRLLALAEDGMPQLSCGIGQQACHTQRQHGLGLADGLAIINAACVDLVTRSGAGVTTESN